MDLSDTFLKKTAEIMNQLGEDVRKMQRETIIRLDAQPEVVMWLAQHGFTSLAQVPPERISEIFVAVRHPSPSQTH